LQVVAPSVRDLLAQADLPAYCDLYDTDWRVSAGVPLLGNTKNMQRAYEVAVHNFDASNDIKTKFFVVAGVPGAGKSRLSFELLRMWDSPVRLRSLEQELGRSVHVIRLFIDFNNGMGYAKGVDSGIMSDDLGARLAAQVLRLPLTSVFERNGRTLRGLSVAEVLSAVLERAAGESGGVSAFLIVLHLDEYQVYLEQLMMHRGGGAAVPQNQRAQLLQDAQVSFKGMLSALKSFARDPVFSRQWQISMLPVLSGTPVLGVPVLPTDKLDPEAMPPAPFDRTMAEELMLSVLLQPRGAAVSPFVALLEEARRVLRNDAARAAIGDSGFRPRLLVSLATNALRQIRATSAAVAARKSLTSGELFGALQVVDWQQARDEVALPLGKSRQLGSAFERLLVEVALLQIPVRFAFPLHEHPSLPVEHALSLAEASGLVELDHAADKEYRLARMPLMQVKEWGTADFLPSFLMDVRNKWHWTYLEQLCAYMMKVRLNYYSPRELTVADLLPGCLGASDTQALRLHARGHAEVFEEKIKFIQRLTDAPVRELSVMATSYGKKQFSMRTLDQGVFCACTGNAWVDVRCSLPLATCGGAFAHIYVQLKHTTTSRTVTTDEIVKWHAGVKSSTARWRSGSDRTIFVFVSNRRAAEGTAGELVGQFFDDDERHDLLVCTSNQLAALMTPTFAHRALLPVDAVPGEAVASFPGPSI